MSTAGELWFWAVLPPAISFFSQNMCIWPAPRSLGVVALTLLWASGFTIYFFLAGLPATVYFAAASLIYRNKCGELVWRISMALSCLRFIGLRYPMPFGLGDLDLLPPLDPWLARFCGLSADRVAQILRSEWDGITT